MLQLYLDGCSMVHGHGIPRESSLGRLFEVEGYYQVTDQSRNGKSNIAIVLDTYKNFQDYDTFVLGFTYSARFGIKYQDQNLDFFPGFHGSRSDLEPESLDHTHVEMYKYFYSVFGTPYCNDLSDMLIDGLISFLISQNKKVLGFSWEKRNTINDLKYPYIGNYGRLPDGHLNILGTKELFNFLQNILNE